MTNKHQASDDQQKEHSKRESSAGAKALKDPRQEQGWLVQRSKWPSGWSMMRWRLRSRPCNPRLIYHEVNEMTFCNITIN